MDEVINIIPDNHMLYIGDCQLQDSYYKMNRKLLDSNLA